jgi:branched-chain amino acid transport system substrate-binding protein
MSNKPVRKSLLIALTCAALVAACSSNSSSNPNGSSPQTGGQSGQSLSAAGPAKVITLGLLTSVTGPLAAEFGPATVAAAKARIALANDTHELPGVTFKLVVQDDQSSPAGALSAIQILVNQDHVFAILDASSLFGAVYKYTVQNNVPVLGWADATEFSDPANKNLFAYFGSPANNYPPIKNLGLFFKSQGATKLCRIATADVPAAISTADQIANSAKEVGISATYEADLPLTTTDVNPTALAIQNSGCDALGIILPANTYSALLQDVANLGVHLKSSYGPAYNDSVLSPSSVAAANGLDYLSQFQPFWMKTAASERVRAALAKYAGENIPVTGAPPAGMFWGWMPADLAITGVKVGGGASATPDMFITNLRKATDYDAGGYVCPVDFSKFDYVLAGPYSTCVYMSQLKNGKFGAPPNLTEPVRLTN